MRARLNPYEVAQDGVKPLMALEDYVAHCGLETSLFYLVKIRASQINGCAFCIHMHTRDARAEGETEMRIHMLDAWRESSFYTDRERAALAWTEAVTLIAKTHAPDADFEELRRYFSEEEAAKLTLLIGTINIWNRVAISFRMQHPKTDVGQQTAAAA
jgi:AhpD family alkylhydroperoxidase